MTTKTGFSPSAYLRDSSREYAIYVCDSRGIPLVSDGLKHGQRMALWLLRHRADKIKTYALSGLLGYERIYSHGEASANGAIGLLAAPFRNNHCLIEGLGHFGSRVAPDKNGIGAPRYTEVRRSKAAEAMLYRDLDLVPLCENYDGSNHQPVTFLPLIPTVLLNGVVGVAVGWSTDILPRSLKDLVEATKAALLDKPLAIIPPHFQRYNITVKATGKPNQWEFSGRVEIVDTSTMRITELPPGFAIEAFRKRLIEMEENEDIQNFTDRSTDAIDITIRMKRGAIKGWTEDVALDFLRCREKTTERIVVRDWSGDAIRTYDTAEALVRDFAQWRLGWYSKRFEKLRDDDAAELRYWMALAALIERGFPAMLGTFADRTAMQEAIMAILEGLPACRIDADQLERVVNLPTYRWTRDFAADIGDRVHALQTSIASHLAILASPDRLRQVFLDELDALRSFKS